MSHPIKDKTAPFEIFDIYLPGNYPVAGSAAFIERESDHYIYDANGDKTFKPDTGMTTQFITFQQDTGSFEGRQAAYIPLDPAQFTDGDYICNFCLPSMPLKPIFTMSMFSVFGGSARTQPLTLPNIAQAVVAALPTTSGGSAPTAQQNAQAVVAALPPYPVPPTADAVATAVVAKLPTSTGGAPTAQQNAQAVVAALPPYPVPPTVQQIVSAMPAYPVPPTPAVIAQAVKAILPTSSGGTGGTAPTAAQNAAAFASFQYKTVTDPGSVSALLAAINTGLGNAAALGPRMDNVATALASMNTAVTTLGTNQHNNLASVSTLVAALQTRQDNVSAALKFVTDSLTALSTSQHNNLLNTNTTMASIQSQLTALATSLNAIKTKVGA